MKRYLYMTFAVLGFLGSTVPYAEAGNLTGVRVSNHEGTSRIVLDVSEMPVSWTRSYNEATHALILNLGGTTNGLTGPISQNDTKTGVLKGIGLQPVNGSLQVTLTANKDVQHHEFTLEKPTRIVVDLFSSYAQQTTKDINKSVAYSKINNTVPEGKIQAYALTVDNDSPMVVAHVPEGKTLAAVSQAHTSLIGAKVKGGSFERPYSVASDGTIDLERISNRGTLRYTPNRGYFIEEKKPLLQAKTQKESFMITAVNAPRKENALTLYTNAYGPSTKTNDYGYEVTVANGKVISGQ
ncbi:MAG: AMIN domain-containing protein, partial [Veillonella sp.]|nr:AMIN domain-containing protein [Veillonella sp.]